STDAAPQATGAVAYCRRPARRALLGRERRLRPERHRDAARGVALAREARRRRRGARAALRCTPRRRLLPALQARAATPARAGRRTGGGAERRAPGRVPRP